MAVTVKDINWRECEKLKSYTFLTDMQHVVRVVKHSIPIVFIPGIMGSRLINSDGKAWDPDDAIFMLWNYIRTGAEAHKHLLVDQAHAVIGHPPPPGDAKATPQQQADQKKKQDKASKSDQEDLKSRFAGKLKGKLNPDSPGWQWLPMRADVTGDARVKQAAQILVDHGWGEVAKDFYEDFLFLLGGANFQALERCFCFPVYARGYNWVGSNDDSGKYLTTEIQNIIKAEKAIPGRECDRVMLISHSMGGLASRSAMMLHGLQASCFGALHGAQPATGAPEAYREMRGGAEGTFAVSSYVVGHTSQLVMPVLANCAGGLELLPNRRYKTNAGKSAWLQQLGSKGETIQALPKRADPYGEIYKADKNFLGLMRNPERLDPGGTARKNPSIKQGRVQKPEDQAKGLIDQADAFHKHLNTLHHGKTAVAFGYSGPPTYDLIDYKYERPYQKQDVYNHAGDVTAYKPDSNPLDGRGADLDGDTWYLMDTKHGAGDGTVPRSSGGSLPPTYRKPFQTNGPAHPEFYKDPGVHQFAVDTVAMLAEEYRKAEVGK